METIVFCDVKLYRPTMINQSSSKMYLKSGNVQYFATGSSMKDRVRELCQVRDFM